MRCALVIQHLAFENPGTLQPALLETGFTIETLQAGIDDLASVDALSPELLVVLGGPIGVYEYDIYPFLADEIRLLTKRLAAKRPILGICLGAQLMSAALGGKVFPGTHGKEIGWAPITRAHTLQQPSVLDALFVPELKVLHWHGDTFQLPADATHLASSAQYANQAFSLGDYGLALQFHIEVQLNALESWYIGHSAELTQAKISIAQLRADGIKHAPLLERAAKSVWDGYLSKLPR